MPTANRGEVWIIDLGLAAKIRPCLVVSLPFRDDDRALITIVPHTTAVRGTSHEVMVKAKFLKPGVFDIHNIVSIPDSKLVRKIGELSAEDLAEIADALRRRLGL